MFGGVLDYILFSGLQKVSVTLQDSTTSPLGYINPLPLILNSPIHRNMQYSYWYIQTYGEYLILGGVGFDVRGGDCKGS